MIPATADASPVTEVRARMFGCPRAETVTRLVRLQPTRAVFDHICADVNPNAKLSVIGVFADELYELSNAPFRQEQREAIWGKNRSLSVGDVVEIDFADGEKWMAICKPMGWAYVKFDQALIDKLEAGQTMFDREDIVRDIQTETSFS